MQNPRAYSYTMLFSAGAGDARELRATLLENGRGPVGLTAEAAIRGTVRVVSLVVEEKHLDARGDTSWREVATDSIALDAARMALFTFFQRGGKRRGMGDPLPIGTVRWNDDDDCFDLVAAEER